VGRAPRCHLAWRQPAEELRVNDIVIDEGTEAKVEVSGRVVFRTRLGNGVSRPRVPGSVRDWGKQVAVAIGPIGDPAEGREPPWAVLDVAADSQSPLAVGPVFPSLIGRAERFAPYLASHEQRIKLRDARWTLLRIVGGPRRMGAPKVAKADWEGLKLLALSFAASWSARPAAAFMVEHQVRRGAAARAPSASPKPFNLGEDRNMRRPPSVAHHAKLCGGDHRVDWPARIAARARHGEGRC